MVSTFLFEGKENAQTGAYLCKVMNLSPRQLTEAIEQERRSGAPICATCGNKPGYYLASDKQEMADYCKSLKNRAIQIFITRQACLKTIETLGGE